LGGNDIWGGKDISGGNDIRGGKDIRGGNDIWGGNNLIGVSKCIFCNKKEGIKLFLFNKKVSEKRFTEIWNKLENFNWYPKFNNIIKLYKANGEVWEKTPINKAKSVEKVEAWADMPKEMLEYITGLKEFNAKIFLEITGIKAKKIQRI
jgi:hypothetical protein